jgi:hypothetical protein
MKKWFLAAAAVAALSPAGVAQAATTANTTIKLVNANQTSSNWSGYIASGQSFSDVKGTWVQPTATCAARATNDSSFWVGLGGATSSSTGLEQIGTNSNCVLGAPVYSAWYELIPAASVAIPMTISPGDTMNAEVSVAGSQVTLTLTDATTGSTFTKNVTLTNNLDTSSAEWIAEAPAQCAGNTVSSSGCRVLPLTSFGTVAFSNASATANGQTGVISNAAWTSSAVDLRGTLGGASATTAALGADGASFTVTATPAATTTTTPPSTVRPTPPRAPSWFWWHPRHHR